jgi:putative ABC transport system permease protein
MLSDYSGGIFRELRYTLRQLRHSPGFTLTAVLILSLGIGATTAMYSIVRSTLLQPLPYPRQSELVALDFEPPGHAPDSRQTGETADFLLQHAVSFSSMGVADGSARGQNFSATNGEPVVIRSLRVSSGYLPTLGVSPALGRTFSKEEDIVGADPVIVISESLWRKSLGSDPNVVGRTVHINGDPCTVIGVVPSRFATLDSPDVWRPLHLSPADEGYLGENFQMVGRLREGVSPDQAASQIAALTPSIFHQYPGYLAWSKAGAPNWQEYIWPLQQVVVSSARGSLLLLTSAVLAALLMACLNLAGLITARSVVQHSNFVLRSALGATWVSLVRIVLLETFVLAIVASFLGVAFSASAVPLLLRFGPIDLPGLHAASTDLELVLFALGLGCVTTLLCSMLRLVGLFRGRKSLAFSTRIAGENISRQRLGKVLVVSQVAVTTVLISVGAVLLGAFLKMRATPSGVQSRQLYVMQVNLKGSAYTSAEHTQQFIAKVQEELRARPGVVEASTINGFLLDRGLNQFGYPVGHRELKTPIELRFITPGYFQTVGISLDAGRDFDATDAINSQRVALVNQRAAQQWFPGGSAVDGSISLGHGPVRVIGVVSDVHARSLAAAVEPMVYVPYSQADDETTATINDWFATTFVFRTAFQDDSHTPDMGKAAAAAVAAVNPAMPVSKFAAMQSFVDQDLAAPQFFSWLTGAFAVFALLLTVIGLFGLLAYQVATGTREFGVRMAVGATPSQVMTLVLRRGFMLTILGLLGGITISMAVRATVVSFLAQSVHVSSNSIAGILTDPSLPLIASTCIMLLVSVVASLVPARRATAIQPVEALRSE